MVALMVALLLCPSRAIAANEDPPPPPPGDKHNIAGVTIGVTALALGLGAFAWWKDKDLEPLHLRETGYFGRRTYAGGADKAGHMFSNYLSIKSMTAIYEALGLSHDKALILASGFVFGIAQAVELIDGFTEHGFEYQDVYANLVGLTLGILTELSPELESIFGMRIGYVPSRAWHRAETGLGTYLNIINDYSGQIIFVDLKPGGVLRQLGVSPGFSRYLLAGVNWNTYGYAPRDRPNRRRNLGVHVSAAMNEIIGSFELGTKGAVAAAFTKYYALPFVTVALTRDLNNEQWFWCFGLANRATVSLR